MSVKADLNASNRNNFFELFGFDFLVDDDFRTWLIECNTNPYLGVPNTFIKNLLPKMVDDMLDIIIDEKHPLDPSTKPKIDGYKNGFKLLYRYATPKEDKICKCKNIDKCRCKFL